MKRILPLLGLFCTAPMFAQDTPAPEVQKDFLLADYRMRDACVYPDPETQTYYMIASSAGWGRRGSPRPLPSVKLFTSKDLVHWTGPQVIFEAPRDFWGEDRNIRGIWAPELHRYGDRFYLFLTFDTDTQFPEQWRDWLPRVYRGSQVLWSDSITGPYHAFAAHSTLPTDMMTLDGTLWVEDGVPYMVFCHEWVQIKDGTVEMVQLAEDLSATIGEPKRLWDGSDGPWAKKHHQYGCYVTDGCWLYRSKSGKLFMLWTSGGERGYTLGMAVSPSGSIHGPWEQQEAPIFGDDGGHGMLFHRFDGQLMLALHQPNQVPDERIRLFEIEDTGETLRILRPFPAE